MAFDAIQDISVVICAYTGERWYYLTSAVESIQRQSIPPREIVLVIDHNTQLFERARTNIPNVTVIENYEPRGLSGARNCGIAASQGTLIAFLDDDAIAEPDWLERLGNCCQDPQVLGAGGVVEPLWESKRPAWFPHEFYWVVGCTYQDRFSTVTVVRNSYGGCMCIRREVFELVGGFRNGIGRVSGRSLSGGEETELCIRAVQRWSSGVFLCDPHARIHHHIPSSRIRWSYFLTRCYAEGLSKAVITKLVGTKEGLASEWTYTLFTLPKGAARSLADGFFRLDPAGFLRVGAIAAGLMMTIVGYAIGAISYFVMPSKGVGTNISYIFESSKYPRSQKQGFIKSISK